MSVHNDTPTPDLSSKAVVQLQHLAEYLDQIEDRLQSFRAIATRRDDGIDFAFPFGRASFELSNGQVEIRARAGERDDLARIKDLLATAVQVYGKQDSPQIRWTGDFCEETKLPQFREMTVMEITQLTPAMRRIRIAGADLGRFARFGGMHIRMLFPTSRVPQPVWPTLGKNGLAAWPPDDRRPTPRAYTIRRLNVEAGWMDVDFVLHSGDSVGSHWAETALPGSTVGIMGPVGRPVPMDAEWYLMGADETGLPALSRMLETLPASTSGVAFVEVADEGEVIHIDNRTSIEVHWLPRNGTAAGMDKRLVNSVMAVKWPVGLACFGWFAAEAEGASIIRNYWRTELGLGRDQTLAASYWDRMKAGSMATGGLAKA
ncbi:siderophore-interacting protein [uncultured Nitratireductor sp.]|uniref:siderophore-interacting protein n=1 Tax=uncultured Nitratireductor sp. TaxID=520953 RepID=UPI0025ED23B0|nr:siderophore-interacting protein [uncultured Nitratireductor sp.]